MQAMIRFFVASLSIAVVSSLAQAADRKIQFEADGKKLNGTLRLPKGTGSFPAIIIVHGTAGIDARGAFYRQPLEAAGFATFEVDFKSGVFSSPKDRPQPTTFVSFLYASVAALHEQSQIDRSRIGVIGFSLGGQTALLSGLKGLSAPFEAKGLKIKAAVSLYPSCEVLASRAANYGGTPLLILVGSNDSYTTPEACRAAEREVNARLPGAIEAVIFDGTYHAFEVNGSKRTIEDPAAKDGKAVIAYSKPAADEARKRAAEFFRKQLGK